jgi:hypothetical protein
MKNQLLKLILLALINITSCIWVGYVVNQIIENKKFVYSNSLENENSENKTENKTDNKLVIEFIYDNSIFKFVNRDFSETKKNFSYLVKKTKEVTLKNIPPPPKSL